MRTVRRELRSLAIFSLSLFCVLACGAAVSRNGQPQRDAAAEGSPPADAGSFPEAETSAASTNDTGAPSDAVVDAGCEGGVYCAQRCGAGYYWQAECVGGQLYCETGIRTDSCPPGTCFQEFGGPHCCQAGHLITAYCDTPLSGARCLDGSSPALTRVCDGGCPPMDYCL